MRYHVLNFSKCFANHSTLKVFKTLQGAKKFINNNFEKYFYLCIYCYDDNSLFSHSYTFDKDKQIFNKHY